jgi:transcriptional regulator with XRE-family HTH domain
MATRRASAVDIHVGQRVRAARLAHGKSQEELADAIGVTLQQIQKYEKGKDRIGTGRLYVIAQFLDEPPAYFFEGLEEQPFTSSDESALSAITDALNTKESIRIAIALSRIGNPETRRRIADLLEEVIEDEIRTARSLKIVRRS